MSARGPPRYRARAYPLVPLFAPLASLAPHTTLGVGGPAARWAEAHHESELISLTRDLVHRGLPYTLLGGGSNVVIADEGIEEHAVGVATRGTRFESVSGGLTLVEAAAGEPWDGFVEACVERGLAGLECLSGIPGSVGATPIQNVGAYGQEVAGCLAYVRVYDPRRDEITTLDRDACGFGYRDSVFKREGPGLRVVLAVGFSLRHGSPSVPTYAELARALDAKGQGARTLSDVRETIIALRRAKAMVVDPAIEDSRSAGSFFTNPVLTEATWSEARARMERAGLLSPGERAPVFETDSDRIKVAAAWLIERAGFRKGYRCGGAAISREHALAIVNRGTASAADIVRLAREIRAGVQKTCGVTLTPEPVFLGFKSDPLAD